MTSPTASLNPFRALVVHRNFRLFWTGQTLSLIGTWMQSMALGWLALELSDNAFLVGLVAFAGSLPILLLSLPAGVYVDRASKLRIVIVAQALLLVEAALLWWLTWSGHATIGWLLALAALNGLFSSFEIPARQAMMVELVAREDLRAAIALNSSGFNLARIVGPAVGALVIARAGLAWCFGANALSYLAVLGGLFMIRLPPWEADVRLTGAPWGEIRQLGRYVVGTPTIRALMQVIAVFSICGVPYLTLMPVVARERLGAGASGYGVLLACVGMGGLGGALFVASLGSRLRRGRLLVGASAAFGALLVLFAITRSEPLARALLLATGFAMIVNNAVSNAILQETVPDELRGRMMSLYSLVVVGLSQVVGSLAAGAVAHAFGVAWAVGGGAAVMLLFAAYVFRRHPELSAL